jgi:hypothetical protein
VAVSFCRGATSSASYNPCGALIVRATVTAGFANAGLAEKLFCDLAVVPSILCRSNAAATSRPSVSNISHYDDLVLGGSEAGKYMLGGEGLRVLFATEQTRG